MRTSLVVGALLAAFSLSLAAAEESQRSLVVRVPQRDPGNLRQLLQGTVGKLSGLELARVCSAAGLGGLACCFAPPAVQQALGFVRALRFWRRALPIYVDYRVTHFRLKRNPDISQVEREQRFEVLHSRHAPAVLQLVLSLRGFYVKIGQVGSTRRDLFPGPWIDELRMLQGEHPELLAKPLGDMQRMLRRELGADAELIEELSPTPLGAAATGQVHRARLRDGRDVVVKVQYPEAYRLFRQDFANAKLFCSIAQPEVLSYLDELQERFLTEFDFSREAADLAEISRNFAEGTGNPYEGLVRVPVPVTELSSRRVVVMEYLPGDTLLSYGLRKKRQLEAALLPVRLWQGWRLARELRAHLRTLVGVQGYQVLVDGVFNGDPHPGNILLMPDGRLGLIDYGNVDRLSVQKRGLLGSLILALAAGDREAVVAHAREMGFRTQYNDPEFVFRYACISFDRDDAQSLVLPDGTRFRNVQLYFEALHARDPLLAMAPGFVMAARNSFLIRGLAGHLNVNLRIALAWRHLAHHAVQRAAGGPASPTRLRGG